MAYVEPSAKSYAQTPGASDWNIIVNNLKDHETRITALEANEEPETPTNIPVGGIILWSGAIVDIPDHFVLCDGDNDTPDLTDRFIIGAGGSYAVDDSGGAETHVHEVGNTNSGGGHSHSYSTTTGSPSATAEAAAGSIAAGAGHTHSISGSTNSAGSHVHSVPDTEPASSMPKYYALAFIMRVD